MKQLSILLWFVCGMLLTAGCGVVNTVKKSLVEVKQQAPGIGENLTRGLASGLDTARLDELVARLVHAAGQSVQAELDSVSIRRLEDSVRTSLNALMADAEGGLHHLLADTAALNPLEVKLHMALLDLTRQLDQSLARALPTLLNAAAEGRILLLRDSLLGEKTGALASAILVDAFDNMLGSPELDSLLNKVELAVGKTTGDIDRTSGKISKTVRTIALAGGGVLLALSLLFFVLWMRKNSQARRQRDLLVNLTKSIDAIPSQSAYDQTMADLQQRLAAADDQQEILRNILREHQSQYTGKQQFQAHHQRLLELLRTDPAAAEIRARLLARANDPSFATYLNH
ncbi:hypothetical protein QWY85_20245 [Neolewinella lacunae]|uniref:Uncharacterized protein n=1 Tax=Neolewinella lacunae TaxID=1517758 RepID=A0A923PSQ2_9BACT|nr:hypothetical protein [Neolewinella lacunae]MBC6996784.1 hypothetical protein [Neolewinella lacunae]MDN3637012.1 hypothetical protein [Neolewinella lacunae]